MLRPALIAVLSTFALSACGVSQSLYQARLNELQRCESDAAANRALAAVHSDELNREREELGKRADALSAQVERLTAERKRLSENLKSSQHELDDLRRAHEAADDRTRSYQELSQRLTPLVDERKLKLELRRTRLVLILPAASLFDSRRADLSRGGQDTLRQVAAALRELSDRNVQVAGHTDSSPPQQYGNFRSNWELSTAYALAVVKFLQTTGIDPRRLRVVGFSEFSPLPTSGSNGDRRSNRRVELIILPAADESFRVEDMARPRAPTRLELADTPPKPADGAAPAATSPPPPAQPTPSESASAPATPSTPPKPAEEAAPERASPPSPHPPVPAAPDRHAH